MNRFTGHENHKAQLEQLETEMAKYLEALSYAS